MPETLMDGVAWGEGSISLDKEQLCCFLAETTRMCPHLLNRSLACLPETCADHGWTS